MRTMRTAQRGGLLATALMVAALGTACGSDDEATDVGLTTDETTAAEEPMEEETTEESEGTGETAEQSATGPYDFDDLPEELQRAFEGEE